MSLASNVRVIIIVNIDTSSNHTKKLLFLNSHSLGDVNVSVAEAAFCSSSANLTAASCYTKKGRSDISHSIILHTSMGYLQF